MTPRRPAPKIRLERFAQDAARYLAAAPSAVEGEGLVSQLCRHDTLYAPRFAAWVAALGYDMRAHRKLWELAYILQALEEAGAIRAGARGLGFAVGQEPIPAFLAGRGCEILATDIAAEGDRNAGWAETGQWADGLTSLARPDLCPPEDFTRRVSFRAVDMNAIPDDLTGFDFTWSTCSFEHCGSIELGVRFLERQMDCLKPGGVAVHSTEFNLTSNRDTWTEGATAIYRLRDIVEIIERLQKRGHRVAPLDLRLGEHPLDRHVDTGAEGYSHVKHLRLALGRYACTSIGLIITKGAADGVVAGG